MPKVLRSEYEVHLSIDMAPFAFDKEATNVLTDDDIRNTRLPPSPLGAIDGLLDLPAFAAPTDTGSTL